MKKYVYTLFLRDPVTKDTQHGTISIEVDKGYLDFHELVKYLNSSNVLDSIAKNHTLIAFTIVDVTETSPSSL